VAGGVTGVAPGPLRWAIVLIDFDPAMGHEQGGHRRALVVSYEAFHRSGMATVCPITTRAPKYPGEVPIPAGHAGQTRAGLVLCHQIRTIDLGRVSAFEIGGTRQIVTDPSVRAAVRSALAHQIGLDLRPEADGAGVVPG
jgi:mRNA-degrading endonuclease toxin of MazEF toxin-antitoxin module